MPYTSPAPHHATRVSEHAKGAVRCVLVETADGSVTEFRPTGEKDTASLSVTPSYDPANTRVALELHLSNANRTGADGSAWTHYDNASCHVGERQSERAARAERNSLPRTEHGRTNPAIDYRFIDHGMPALVFVSNGPDEMQNALVWAAGRNYQVPEDRRSRALLRAMLDVARAELDDAEAKEVAA